MTLVIGVCAKRSIWIAADRRLTCEGKVEDDNATKILPLHTPDGRALIAYAGLGRTAKGMEPSEWMRNVLRGEDRLLVPALNVLADACARRLPLHLADLGGSGYPRHQIVIPAAIGKKPILYIIDLVVDEGRTRYQMQTTRLVARDGADSRPPRIILAGSGAECAGRNRAMLRSLNSLINAYEYGKISGHFVADHIATINNYVAALEPTVGPNCMVVWRKLPHGGSHQHYEGRRRVLNQAAPLELWHGQNFDFSRAQEKIMQASIELLGATQETILANSRKREVMHKMFKVMSESHNQALKDSDLPSDDRLP